MNSDELLDRLLSILEDTVLPLTRQAVRQGNKIFGAAILRKSDFSLVIAGANEEVRNPLLHGEVSCLNRFWAMPEPDRPTPGDCLFLSTHEPCSMCLSAITWSGFDNFYYFFSYEDSRDEFAIPHDLNILKEVFRCEHGNYARSNSYWFSYHLQNMIDNGDEAKRAQWIDRVNALKSEYAALSDQYQRLKTGHAIPLK